jgi:hypothetical protein
MRAARGLLRATVTAMRNGNPILTYMTNPRTHIDDTLSTTADGPSVRLRELPALRLAFAGAGTLVLTGVILAARGSDWFLLLPALVGSGLLFSALAGFCPLAFVTERWVRMRRG